MGARSDCNPRTGTRIARIRLPCLRFCVLLAILLSSNRTCFATETFITDITTFFGSKYKTGIISFEQGSGTTTGQLQLIDNPTPIPISVVHHANGDMDLTFGTLGSDRNAGLEYVNGRWAVHNSQRMKRWINPYNRVIERPLSGPLSEASKIFSLWDCGLDYGSVQVRFAPGTSRGMIEDAFVRDESLRLAWSDNQTEIILSGDLGLKETPAFRQQSLLESVAFFADRATFTESSRKIWAETLQFTVEIGSELSIVKALRKLPFVEFADISDTGCGGSDREYVLLKKGLMFKSSVFDKDAFLSFLDSSLTGFLTRTVNSRRFNTRISPPEVGTIHAPPFSSFAKYHVVAASEATRNYPNEWDMFDVNFEPFSPTATAESEYGVIIYVENLSSSKRSLGNDQPPGEEQFTSRESRPGREAQITDVITRLLGALPTAAHCVTGNAMEAPDIKKHPSDYRQVALKNSPPCESDSQ